MFIFLLQLSIGVGYSHAQYEPEYYGKTQGIIRIEQKLTDDLSINYLHSSSLKDGADHAPPDIDLITIELKLWR